MDSLGSNDGLDAEGGNHPEDVATLFSWAHLRGGKYRDFSSTRAKMREQARERVQRALEEEKNQQEEKAERKAAEVEAARRALEIHAGTPVSMPQQVVPAGLVSAAVLPVSSSFSGSPSVDSLVTQSAAGQFGGGHIQGKEPEQVSGQTSAQVRAVSPPAPFSASLPAPPSEVPQRRGSGWYALKNIFGRSQAVGNAPVEMRAQPMVRSTPVLAVFSLAGGVGKTSILANVSRVLSSRGENLLLVDTSAFGLLPFFFGARDQRPGVLRTFSPMASSDDVPIQLISIDRVTDGGADQLSTEIRNYARNCGRVLVDLATASSAALQQLLPFAPTVLVPLVPDMSSVVSVGAIESFFQGENGQGVNAPDTKQVSPYYILNRFDASEPLHQDVCEVLRERIGDRLLPFMLRKHPAVSEALAEGITVLDYAPNSPVADDYRQLAGWVRSQAEPAAMTAMHGLRWSER